MKKYILFFLKWTILFIPIESLKNGQLTITPVQAFMGRGLMFHLWFLPALCIGLIAFCVVNSMMKKSRLQVFVTLDGTIGIAILMSFIYLLFLYTNLEIKSITVPPLRVVTSCGYMYFGMAMRKYGTETNIGCINRGTFYRLLIVCYFWICYTVFKTDMIWASSHYNSPMVIVGCFSIFGICLMVKHIPHILNFLLPCTTGIWILHPFAIRVLNKIYRILGMEVSIETKFLNLVFCPVICMVVTCILSKNKWLKRFFTV